MTEKEYKDERYFLLPRDKRQGAEMVITINLLMNISGYLKSLVQMAKD